MSIYKCSLHQTQPLLGISDGANSLSPMWVIAAFTTSAFRDSDHSRSQLHIVCIWFTAFEPTDGAIVFVSSPQIVFVSSFQF